MTVDKNQAIKRVKLIYVSPEENSNKFWCGWVMPDGNLYVEYGRVNYPPRTHLYPGSSVTAASQKLASLVREKTRKGYREAIVEADEARRLDWSPFGKNADQLKQKLGQIASLGELIARHAAIRFDAIKGVFATELGVISLQTVQKANAALHEVSLHLSHPQSHQFSNAVGEYLALIPLPVGMRLDAGSLLGSYEKIDNQRAVLSNLSQGLHLIARLRQEMLELAATSSDTVVEVDRAWWVSWGATAALKKSEFGCYSHDARHGY
jgi:predicted DNA-binding WGR domain protein